MRNQYFILWIFLLALKVNCTTIKIHDAIDDAKQELGELKQIVEGEILAAHSELEELWGDYVTFVAMISRNGAEAIHQEDYTVLAQVTEIIDLAHSAGKDISVCTDIRLGLLNRLSKVYTELMTKCIQDKTVEEEAIFDDAKYKIDIVINDVERLEFQLGQCGDNVACIDPIVTQIDLDLIRLPQRIKTELQETENLVKEIQVSAKECSDINVTGYISDANALLFDIIDCANKILN